MKKILTAIAAAVFIIYPSICFASYVIHLEDGREFATERYWEERDQIKFKRYGGVIGIQKGLVREIEVIEDVEELPAEKVSPKPGTPAAKTEPEKQGTSESSEKTVEVEKPKEQGELEKELDKEKGKEEREKKAKEIDVAHYQRKKRILMENYQEARQILTQARGARDKAKIRKSKKETKRLEKELNDLALKAKKENGGVLPPWWFRVGRKEQVQPPQDRRE